MGIGVSDMTHQDLPEAKGRLEGGSFHQQPFIYIYIYTSYIPYFKLSLNRHFVKTKLRRYVLGEWVPKHTMIIFLGGIWMLLWGDYYYFAKTTTSPWQNDVWKTILSFWGLVTLQKQTLTHPGSIARMSQQASKWLSMGYNLLYLCYKSLILTFY